MGIAKQANKKPNSSATTEGSVPVLEKAIRILYALADREGRVTSSGLAREVGVSQATCYRILKTLERADWIRQNADDGYDLSGGLLPLAKDFVDVTRTARAVQPILDDLAASLGLSAKLSIRVGAQQATLAVANPQRAFHVTAPVGSRYPVVCGASGAALLSQLDDAEVDALATKATKSDWGHERPDDLRRRIAAVRDRGVCENLGLHPQGIDTVAAPVASWSAPSAITLVGLRGDITKPRLPKLKKALLQAAAKAARQSP